MNAIRKTMLVKHVKTKMSICLRLAHRTTTCASQTRPSRPSNAPRLALFGTERATPMGMALKLCPLVFQAETNLTFSRRLYYEMCGMCERTSSKGKGSINISINDLKTLPLNNIHYETSTCDRRRWIYRFTFN